MNGEIIYPKKGKTQVSELDNGDMLLFADTERGDALTLALGTVGPNVYVVIDPDLKWHPTTLTDETLTLAVGVLYPYDNNGTGPDATFPANPFDGNEVAVKEVVGGGTGIFFLTPNTGQTVELPDGTTVVAPNQEGIEAEALVCRWKWRAATNTWHLLEAHAINAGAINVGTP